LDRWYIINFHKAHATLQFFRNASLEIDFKRNRVRGRLVKVRE
jgi:hypothetical protein